MPPALQPRICLVFRGTGERITEIEKEGYHKDVLVLWQKKAWLDRPTCNTWANYFSEYVQELPEKIKAYRATASGGRGEFTMPKNEKNMENQNESMGKSLSSLLLVDNLDGQCQPEFATILKGWKSMEGGVARSKKIAMEIV